MSRGQGLLLFQAAVTISILLFFALRTTSSERELGKRVAELQAELNSANGDAANAERENVALEKRIELATAAAEKLAQSGKRLELALHDACKNFPKPTCASLLTLAKISGEDAISLEQHLE